MPNRILRDCTDSEKINQLDVSAERFFYRLIMVVDDYGRFYAHPGLLKARVFPFLLDKIREADISRWMAECQKAGLILLYEVAGKKYLQICEFKQRLDKAKEKYPAPPIGIEPLSSSNEFPAESETKQNPNLETETQSETEAADAAFAGFIGEFNLITARDFKGGKKERQAFRARLKEGFNVEQMVRATLNCFNDKFHQDNPHYLTPEFILRHDKLEKYLNYIIPIAGTTKQGTRIEQAAKANADQLNRVFDGSLKVGS